MGRIQTREDFYEEKSTMEGLISPDCWNPNVHTIPIAFNPNKMCDDLNINGYRPFEMKYTDASHNYSFIYFVHNSVPVVAETIPWRPLKYIHALRSVHLILISDIAGLPVRAIIAVHPPVERDDTVKEFTEYYESVLELIESVDTMYNIPVVVAGDTNFSDENHLLLGKLRHVMKEVTVQNAGGSNHVGEGKHAKAPAFPTMIFVDSKTRVQEGAAEATFITFPGAKAKEQQMSTHYPELDNHQCIVDMNVSRTGYVGNHAAIIFTSNIPCVNQ